MILEIIITLVVVFLSYYFWEHYKISQTTKHFRGPKALPFIGNVHLFPSDPIEIFQIVLNFHKKYGKNVVMWGVGLDWGINISDLKDVETLLASNKLIQKGMEYRYLRPWLGDGLLISSGQKWFNRRRIITPTFHFSILQQFVEVFERQENIMIDKLRQHENGDEFDIQPYVTLCALDIINETAMGVSVNAQNDPNSEYVRAVHEASAIFFDRCFSLLGQWPWLWNCTALARKERASLKILHNYTEKIIRSKREELENQIDNSDPDPDENDIGTKQKVTFLELLLKSTVDGGKPLSDEDIREEVNTFMFAGHDTTSSGILFALYQISQHPDVQKKLYDEIVNIFGVDGSTPMSLNLLQQLKYLEMVLKESLRVNPSVPMFVRTLTEDTILGGVNVPAGANITIPIIVIHRNGENFANPEIFDPERFSPENSQNRNPYAYIPFSAGSRNCIGQKFAMLEMKSAIAKMLINYKLLPAQSQEKNVRVRADLVLRPADGMILKIQPRRTEVI